LKNKCSVWKRIKFPTFWYNCYYFTWSDTYFIQLETLLINHPSNLCSECLYNITAQTGEDYLLIPTPWSTVLPERLTGSQLVKKFPHFMEPEGPLPQSQAPEVRVFLYEDFVTWYILRRGVVNTSPKPLAGGPPLVGCPRLLFQYIRSYSPYWRPFLHPQPEDAPCSGDRDRLIKGWEWIL